MGTYTATIFRNAGLVASIEFPSHNDGPDRERRFKKFLGELGALQLGLHLLPDDRRILGRLAADDSSLISRRRVRQVNEAVHLRFIDHDAADTPPEGYELKAAVERAADSIRQQAFAGASRGQRNTHSIYVEVVKSIATAPDTVPTDMPARVVKVQDRLEDLSQRSHQYARFGLAADLAVTDLVQNIVSTPREKQPTVDAVLTPYIRGIEARLKALQRTYDLIERFLTSVNDFFGDSKQMTFDLHGGFRIMAAGHPITFGMLSSGERQLLLLLCNTLAARESAAIFIIDEPEISLNIKWQRRLVRSLLDCIQGSQVQLIFATHSIELLAQHRGHVVKLAPRDRGGAEAVRRGTEDGTGEAIDQRLGGQV